jgi:Tfp pilus assembly protein PilE
MKTSNNKGFTIIELIICVICIAMLVVLIPVALKLAMILLSWAIN